MIILLKNNAVETELVFMYEAIFCIVWLLAGFITGVSGLGAAMFAVPFISVFIDPHTLIPVSTCLVVVLCFEVGYIYRRDLLFTELKNMTIGSLPGLLLGTYILLIIPTAVLLLCIGIVMVCFVLWQFLHKMPAKAGQMAAGKALAAGFISGLLSTSVSFGGPPCAVYALHGHWTQKQTLATINVFVSLSSLLGVGTYLFTGLIDKEVLYWTLLGTPAVSLGILLSVPVIRFIDIRLFRKILLIIIGFGGLSCIVKSFLQGL